MRILIFDFKNSSLQKFQKLIQNSNEPVAYPFPLFAPGTLIVIQKSRVSLSPKNHYCQFQQKRLIMVLSMQKLSPMKNL